MPRAFPVAVLALVVFSAAACAPQKPPTEHEAVRRNIAVQTISPRPIEIRVKLPVTLKAREDIELRAAQAGTILDLPFEEGQIVPQSSVPKAAWIEADEFVKANPGLGLTDDAVLYRNLAHLASVPAFARMDDRALRTNFREAQAQYDAATRGLNRVLSYKDSTEAQIDTARTARVGARANCDRLLHMIEDAYVTNPVRGILNRRLHRSGEYVNNGELLGMVAVLDPMVAVLNVPEDHKEAVKVGADLDITIRSVNDNLGKPVAIKARIRLVDQVAHATTHTFRVEADIANADLKLPAGVFGTTQLLIYSQPAALTVPLTALKLKGERISLFVLADGGKVKEVQDINVGHMTSDWVELLGDKVRQGDRVVVMGAQLLADADLVTVRQDPTATPAKDGRS
ncbi:MAG: efflux RND transporter periplasmic adaptor subunit [Planctomycetes bacterium]|nr:efflux RND transporter periplasmic adaptor subunit [Planctomycetota bacterium]